MRSFSGAEIERALGQCASGLRKYLWLQHHVLSCDVSADAAFQTCFNGFYRVRRGNDWRVAYYALMESSKLSGIDFSRALNEIKHRTGRVEASFASKLVATLDPRKPVIDKFVLRQLVLRLPYWSATDRIPQTVHLYQDLCDRYRELIQSPAGKMIQDSFDRRFPDSGLTDLKKIDLVLWQIGR